MARGVPVGVLVIDKPVGPTSHDVVARVRRALKEKRIGHAGTLDPMASGVLVVLVGEATKLAPFLTAHDKSYAAQVALGASTDTLDAAGTITEERDVPAWLVDELAAARRGAMAEAPRLSSALEAERARSEQQPPAFSAIKVGGKRSYDVARAGGELELAARVVSVKRIDVVPDAAHDTSTSPDRLVVALALELEVSKGYYVRSLARDIGERLGVPAHLAALRRTKSGPFTLASAVRLDAGPDALKRALIPITAAVRQSLPEARLTASGAERARHGKALDASDFTVEPPASSDLSAWLDPAGELVAVGLREGSKLVVQRGFARETSDERGPDAAGDK